METPHISRRGLLAGGSALAATSMLPHLAEAQSTDVVRIAMSISDVPRMWGGPEAGFEGVRFGAYFVYDALVLWDLSRSDTAPSLTPGLAESWRVDPADRRRWIFTLRQGVRFHDGSPFTADAAIWNLDALFRQDSPQFNGARAGLVRGRTPSVASYEKIDDRTIAIVTHQVDSTFIFQATFMWFASPTHWQAMPGDNAEQKWQRFAMNPSGTGPYRVTSITPRERCELAANRDYWNPQRVPKTPRTVLIPMPDGNARVAALRSGQVDLIETVPTDAIASLRQAGMQIVTNSYPHIWSWRLNCTPESPFSDIRIRRAANLAIDRPGMVELLSGMALPAKGKIPTDHPWFGRPTFDITYNPDEARRLVREAGFGPNRPVQVRVLMPTAGGGQMVPLPMNEAIQQMLAQVHINVEFLPIDFATAINMMRAGARAPDQRGAHALNVAIPSMEPATGWLIYDSNLVTPRGINWGFYNNPAFDAQLNVVRQAFDPAAQNAEMAKLHEILVNDAAGLYVVHDLNPRALGPRVSGFVQARNWFQDYTPLAIRPGA